ncbi:alternative ribosome rescue aminoacyl-tRNA hydrolase ArfB [Pedobacter aquatilis]|uniref:alternative ribosome rescue aminoacyl-tRNA hydrolase ArfB n=1 Tax=Pedobacter aquatilis TaxID=351343 RepID=UPI0025B59CF6|nr:alternative ribosome rescue aminoacyl-tRNA hydrolase ArfB [Pedobacter aquatilis]MDN3588000.1 alternative ribosome rescue aminoacyl-tRNA hydrolase ArfB [Pedobacter aquatilis]
MIPDKEQILKNISFKTSRSSGKGGQNVNKVSSKVELIFNISTASFLSQQEKELLLKKLSNRIDNEGLLHIVTQEDRSQLLNKEKTIVKLIDLIKKSLLVQKERKAVKIPKAIIEKRLRNKAENSSKKETRRKPSLD